VIGLSVGYRIPAQIMEVANRVMAVATPELRAPTSVRDGGAPPEFIAASSAAELADAVVDAARTMSAELSGNIAVVAADADVDGLISHLVGRGIDAGKATRTGLEKGVNVVPVTLVKGLELDGVIVVEPADIVDAEQQGLRALYVALTRSTQRLTVVHAKPLPESMR
jgi:DNA helicase IV